MGLSNTIIDLLTPGFDRGRKPRRLFEQGEQGQEATAQIVGINYEASRASRSKSASHDELMHVTELALRVGGPSPRLFGVEQRLDPQSELRLGEVVRVHVDRDRAVLAPEPSSDLRAQQPRWFCHPPEPGIHDPSLWAHVQSRRDGLPATIVFTECRAVTGISGVKISATALVQGDGFEAFEAHSDDVQLRPYSSHLERLNLRLPGWARPGKRNEFVVDWAAAANIEPGPGQPPGYFRQLMTADCSSAH